MFVLRVRFATTAESVEKASELASWLLATWYKHGQILRDWIVVGGDRDITAYVVAPAQDALDDAHANLYVRRDMAELATLGVTPEIAFLGTSPGLEPGCCCAQRDALILFTTYIAQEPPLCCGTCFLPVPLYAIPRPDDCEYLDILLWQRDYQACDTLQMNTTTGERFGEQQLFRHDSRLSLRGRALAAEIAKAMQIPVYSYLHKTRGKSQAAERDRRCPQCGGPWRLDEPWHIFDFRCDACCLLSNIATSVR